MAAPTLDNVSSSGAPNTSGPVTFSLATSQNNAIICVCTYSENGHNPTGHVTSITGGSLTFAARQVVNSITGGVMELWWALAPTALGATTFTINLSGSCDAFVFTAFGVLGCDTTTPWDSNVSLPATVAGATVFTPGVTVSTTHADDFLIFATGANANYAAGTTEPAGFTNIDKGASGFFDFCDIAVCYQGVTSLQTSQTFTWGSSITPTDTGYAIFDALTADSATPPTSADASITMDEVVGGATPAMIAAITSQDIIAADSSNPVIAAITLMETIRQNGVIINIVNNTGMKVGIGGAAVIWSSILAVVAQNNALPNSSLLYVITTPPAHGFFTVNGAVASTFYQSDLDAGRVIYYANDYAYRYAYEAPDIIQYTDETPLRNEAANSLTYYEPGSTTRADSFVFELAGDSGTATTPTTFPITLVDQGFAIANEPVGSEGMWSMTPAPEDMPLPTIPELLAV